VTKDRLYAISKKLYSVKDKLECYLSRKTNELFDLEDKILLFDLTNTYFVITTKIKSKAALFHFINLLIFNNIIDYFIKTAFDNKSIL